MLFKIRPERQRTYHHGLNKPILDVFQIFSTLVDIVLVGLRASRRHVVLKSGGRATFEFERSFGRLRPWTLDLARSWRERITGVA